MQSNFPGTQSEAAVPIAKSWSVLVVEDSLVTARIIVAVLSRAGFEVSYEPDGKRALAACSTRTFTAILMDYQMPIMNGADATVAIRAAEKLSGNHTPIIGYSSSGDADRCISAGMDDFLQKPATPNVLSSRIAAWCASPPLAA